jgi:hypothetical protein
VLGTKHTAANKLSQRPRTESDNINKANKVNINDFINAELNAFSIALVAVKDALTDLLTDRYSKDSWQIARYLTTLQKLAGIGRTEFQSFKRKAL